MTPLMFAAWMIVMFLFGYVVHWIASSGERRTLKRYRQHAQQLNDLERKRQSLESERRRWGER